MSYCAQTVFKLATYKAILKSYLCSRQNAPIEWKAPWKIGEVFNREERRVLVSYQHVQLLALFNSWYCCAITPNGIIIRRIGRVLYIVEGKAVSTELQLAIIIATRL